jgi:broad specificity phosphatase PhoE
MKIGLIRHFKVDFTPSKKYYSAEEFSDAMDRYENSPIIINPLITHNTGWDICYCSTISRAAETAKNIYNNTIVYSDLIVEVPIAPFTKRKIRLSSFFWHLGGRIAWYRNHCSQPETRKETLCRINNFIDELSGKNYNSVLLVTHGFFMRVFVEQLLKIGYNGKIDLRPENGKLYIFCKGN